MTTAQEVIDAIDEARSYFISLLSDDDAPTLIGFDAPAEPVLLPSGMPVRKPADPSTYTANAVGG